MNLSDVFTAVAYKQLVQVDLPGGSNQHEINGVAALRSFFRTSERISGKINWYYFADNQEPQHGTGDFTFYDARENIENRTQWRFYYRGDFLRRADVGDVLLLARIKGQEDIYGLVFQANSNWIRSARALIELRNPTKQLKLISSEELSKRELESIASLILDELDIEFPFPVRSTDEDLVVQKFDKIFPATIALSRLAREQVEVNLSDPDETLLRWIQREEELFRALERIVVQQKLDSGFESVDDFIKYSLSVQNRRKSRMGYAFQNHIQALLDAYSIRYTPQARTEGGNKPDFLFPGQKEYRDLTFNSNYLTMLALKASCKDRWRQVLPEADRIAEKHLATLEPGISTTQTDEMRRLRVIPVLPRKLLIETYTESQQKEVMTVSQFLSLVRSRQDRVDSH